MSNPSSQSSSSQLRLPAGQQLIAPGKWPVIGEKFQEEFHRADDWQLQLGGLVEPEASWTLQQLRELPQTTIELDIHCVTRWSRYDMQFTGVLLSDLLATASIDDAAKFISFQARSQRNHSTSLPLEEALELGTLLALRYQADDLPAEHGGPLRVIVPRKYFYKSLKWLERIELLAEDKLGFWEAESGYHNGADPWQEQRYMAPTINKQTAARLIESRDFSHQDLRSIDASKRDLDRLQAVGASLRDANFTDCSLSQARFDQANLSNAHFVRTLLVGASFVGADLEGADFCGADLRGADLTGASLFGVSFFQTDEGNSGAIFDTETRLPAGCLDVLTPEQAEYVRDYV